MFADVDHFPKYSCPVEERHSLNLFSLILCCFNNVLHMYYVLVKVTMGISVFTEITAIFMCLKNAMQIY